MLGRAKIVVVLLLFVCGCTSDYKLTKQIIEIEKKHNVTITTDSSSNRNGVGKLLNIIDRDLEQCSQYFKANLGPIFIEDSFDELGLKGMFLVGYVDGSDSWNSYPIHIKNRSMLAKILLYTPRENDVFLHEATHSFELNIKSETVSKWDAFYEEFDRVQGREYKKKALNIRALLPLTPRPVGMPSLYGSANHFEDFAETHCYLKRNDIEKIKNRDPVLYQKCRIVEAFIDPKPIGDVEDVPVDLKEDIEKTKYVNLFSSPN